MYDLIERESFIDTEKFKVEYLKTISARECVSDMFLEGVKLALETGNPSSDADVESFMNDFRDIMTKRVVRQ